MRKELCSFGTDGKQGDASPFFLMFEAFDLFYVELGTSFLLFSSLYLVGQRNRECLSNCWIFFVLGRGGRSQKPQNKGHLISWNNMDSVTEWLYRQIHPFKHKHTPVSQACRELKYRAKIPLPSSF